MLPVNVCNVTGFPDWFQDPSFAHIFKDLDRLYFPGRSSALPAPYQYRGSTVHPVRHKYNNKEDTPTYIYIFDSSPEGTECARQASGIHKIPQGPLSHMKELGKIHYRSIYTPLIIMYRDCCLRVGILAYGSRFEG